MSDQQFLPQRHHGRLVLPPRSRVILEAVVRLTFQVVMDYYSGALYTSDAFEDESGHEDIDIDEATRPMAKRIKLSSSESLANAKRTRRKDQGRLKNMLSLSFDVLFLILAELGPMDLVNLARTSKALRQVLMSRKSMWVWATARRKAGAVMVPDPPEDMSEPAWALLLFGPAVCSQCSTKNVHRVDFALRRRLCIICKKKNLVHSTNIRFQCPDLKDSVADLLPYTKNGWIQDSGSNGRYYWKPDLYDMAQTITELEEDRDSGKAGAHRRLESFREKRIHLVDTIVQSCPEFEKWVEKEVEAQARNYKERRAQRREALKDRILAAGYESADINFIGIHTVPGANTDQELTEKAWRYIRSKVESRLSSARERRLSQRRLREIEHRWKAEQYYRSILRQVLPVQRLYLPSLAQACELSCFRELLSLDRVVQLSEWVHAREQLLESLSEWMSSRRNKYISLLPFDSNGDQEKVMEVKLSSDPSVEVWRRVEMRSFAGRLELATSVFRHLDTKTIHIGREACNAWKMEGELEFLERGAEAVHTLLQELHLSPETTTASMLDQLDRRFICASCPAALQLFPRSWRSCVSHFVDCLEIDHPYPQWQVVSMDMAMRGSFCDLSYPHQPETWHCNHCPDYLSPDLYSFLAGTSNHGTQEHAFKHVQTAHNINHPLVDVDLFLYPADLRVDPLTPYFVIKTWSRVLGSFLERP